MKIVSWNVNGIRAWHKKGCLGLLLEADPDIICLQETKAEKEQLPVELIEIPGYFSYFNSSLERKGHSGTAVYAKINPEKVTYGLGVKDLDGQGRQINLFYKDFVVINCYFPNGGGPEDRLQKKLKYYEEFLKFINKIRKSGKKVIFCGDVNVAHEEIDLARPESNRESIGFLPEERAWVDRFIEDGYVDVFRDAYPDRVEYSYWDTKTRARDRNVGWRIDYFFVDETILDKVVDNKIYGNVLGSDHAPIELAINLKP
ncbi:MAG TPA: exodeoxyribonuclease III [Candidatus Paceibacterota bacterium]|nr:exodeoxyribonuclease III [Candidatus Paceibacterota bacterium]HRZ34254.1 exodeoxyribonuclease III [Candidatus Paceibacterota bacterium]